MRRGPKLARMELAEVWGASDDNNDGADGGADDAVGADDVDAYDAENDHSDDPGDDAVYDDGGYEYKL